MKHFDYSERSKLYFEKYISFLLKWQDHVNLISKGTSDQIWERHICDSAQLFSYFKEDFHVLADMGSGAGFPGVVLGILNAVEKGPLKKIYLIESDLKKSIFLKELVRLLELNNIFIINDRLEKVNFFKADVITARALADLPTLIQLSKGIRKPSSVCLFLKGKNAFNEVSKLSSDFQCQLFPSRTSSEGFVVKITQGEQ